MRTAIGVTVLLAFAALCLNAQAPLEAPGDQPAQAPANLGEILAKIQQSTSSASVNIGKLRIEKWKTDSDQKQQLQQIAGSLQKNIANAVPGLINDVQNSHGSVVSSFKLYHNLNVVYENLSYLADVAGGLGKKEEFEPLAADAAALETARSNLSDYIEQTAVRMETVNRPPAVPTPQARQAVVVPGQKVVVINEDDPAQQKGAKPAAKPAAKSTKKKTSAVDTKKVSAPATPTPAQPSSSPH
jgi:hypothetical protein